MVYSEMFYAILLFFLKSNLIDYVKIWYWEFVKECDEQLIGHKFNLDFCDLVMSVFWDE